jgi:hypothetical protein
MQRNYRATTCYVLVLGLVLLASSEKDLEFRSAPFCVQAKFVRQYHCTSSEPIQVVELMSPNPLATRTTQNDTSGARYYAAMLDLPESVAIVDNTFLHAVSPRHCERKESQNGLLYNGLCAN